ncbi:MAG: hypothetical protein KKH04_09290 [Proteobacteria bacterium]|nr:hypothetical protein [Pseudomonadota bacterium]
MPTTVTGVIILLICVFPGVLGDRVYRTVVGVDWREKEFRSILRLIGFSVIGVLLYSILTSFFKLPPPAHLFPSSYAILSAEKINTVAIPYGGHLLSSIYVGFLAAFGLKLVAKLTPGLEYPCAWDAFVRKHVPEHWVVVGLTSGEVYAGKLKNADISVAAGDRDLILEEPCQYCAVDNQYVALNYQCLFIAAKSLFSIATVHDPNFDERIIPLGENLFKGEKT